MFRGFLLSLPDDCSMVMMYNQTLIAIMLIVHVHVSCQQYKYIVLYCNNRPTLSVTTLQTAYRQHH